MKMELVLSLFSMSLYWLCLCKHVFIVSGLCIDDQKSFLLQLKNNITFSDVEDRSSSSRLNSWNASQDCHGWMGVTCDKDGHVTGLDLSRESISGGFHNSSSLFCLHYLQKLNLASNDLYDVIPSEFNKLKNLTYLNLSGASFMGQIPIEISQLTRLVTLDLSTFYSLDLVLENPNLQKLVQNLTSIRQLHLNGVNIPDPGHEWSKALLSLHDLQELSLLECNLSGPLDPSLASLENLSIIILDDNNLSSPVPQTFSGLKNLTILRLAYCSLTGTFPEKVFKIETLTVIDLSWNDNLHGFFPDFPLGGSLQTIRLHKTYFTGPIPHSLGNMKHLSELDPAFCQFNGTIPNSLSNLTKLSYLDLSYNIFIGPMISFGKVTKLTHLDLSNNHLSGIVPSSHFEGLYNLVIIDLSSNSFTGIIPSSPFTLALLQKIWLSGNKFSQLHELPNVTSSRLETLVIGDNILSGSIPSSLFTLPSLQEIWLSGNKFFQLEFINVTSSRLQSLDMSNNSLFGSIPSSLFTLPRLKDIDLSYNQFSKLDELVNVSSCMLDTLDLTSNNLSGPFPTFFFQLSKLSDLRLSSNKFNGWEQLNKLFELKSLTGLDLSYNNLSANVNIANVDPFSFPIIRYLYLASCNLKSVPGFLRNLSALAVLDLSENQIQGTVPNWIWKLQNLDTLNVSHNLLNGLDGILQNVSSLVTLDLHHNKLQGPIPVFPKDAVYLDYSINNFSTFIPRDIGNYLSSTYFLSLSNNNLHGSIPDSLCNASSLKVLDLSINNISGTIPSCLMMMSDGLVVLDLNNNNLSGSIPDTFQASCALSTLNLHGNLLDGPIPKSLAYCTMLEVLNLGSNQFIGGFPCFLKKILTLRILVLRNNKFHGSLSCSRVNYAWEMLQVLDIAFNNFSGKLLGKYSSSWKGNMMIDEAKARPEYIWKPFYFSISFYYQDSVTVISKGQQIELVKILKIFTSIDFSSNHFEGSIPEELMNFKALYVLNLSNNALSGEIPSSIGNMKQLESLDLSQNSLRGEIPVQLASLSFLSYLNLSFNHLGGKIPTGTQLQSFPASSFEGNDGLYGSPLTEKHDGNDPGLLPQPECGRLACTVDWNFISVELGLVFGLGIVFGPLLIWKQWRVQYWQLIHKILCWIFPQMYLQYVTHRGETYATLRWQN